jgi:DnaK suppressor protein
MGYRVPNQTAYHELTRLLDEQQRRVATRLRMLREDLSRERSAVKDAGDERQDAVAEEIDFALTERAAYTATLIREALTRHDHGRYGTCVDCGGEIGARRLRVLPFTDCCVRCQQRREDFSADGSGALPRASTPRSTEV